MSKKEEEYKLVDLRLRREPIPWKEVRSNKGKKASAPIMAKGAIKIHFDGTTNQPIEDKVCNVTRDASMYHKITTKYSPNGATSQRYATKYQETTTKCSPNGREK